MPLFTAFEPPHAHNTLSHTLSISIYSLSEPLVFSPSPLSIITLLFFSTFFFLKSCLFFFLSAARYEHPNTSACLALLLAAFAFFFFPVLSYFSLSDCNLNLAELYHTILHSIPSPYTMVKHSQDGLSSSLLASKNVLSIAWLC